MRKRGSEQKKIKVAGWRKGGDGDPPRVNEDIPVMPFTPPEKRKDKLWPRLLQWAALLVCVCFVAEMISPTAYGRFGINNSGTIKLDSRLGWWLMELPCSVVFVLNFFYFGGPQSKKNVPRLFAAMFCGHYLYRGWYFPLSMNMYNGSQIFSIVPALFGWVVTITHAYLNAKWYSTYGKHLTWQWIRSWWFVGSAALYYGSFFMIVWHDHILRSLRPCPGGRRYCLPHEGLFVYATSAQYLVELTAWFGFWMMSYGPNGAFIFFISLVNLIPRAYSTHLWYLDRFGDEYASLGRARLIPGVW